MGFKSELIYDKVAIFKIFSYLLFHKVLIGVRNLVLVSVSSHRRVMSLRKVECPA